jgi:DNA polymerase-1
MQLLQAYQLLHDGSLALGRAEQAGIRLDREACQYQIDRQTKRINIAETRFQETELAKTWRTKFDARTNYDSPTQLSHILYDVLGYNPPKATKTGKGAADEEALKILGLKELDYLLQIRKLKKIRDTYLIGYLREQVNGFIHPFFWLNTVETYRSSGSSPNLQNVPKRDAESMNIVRSILFPRKGHQLVEVDISGAEVLVACCYHQDPEMIRYLTDPKSDLHADMAAVLFILDSIDKKVPELYTLRQAAKNGFVFPQFYGDYYINCAVNVACSWGKLPLGKWSEAHGIPLPNGTLGKHFIKKGIYSLNDYTEHVKRVEDDFWRRRFPKYNNWRRRWFEDYQDNGYIDLLTGFRCSGLMRRNECINYPVQGAAFHCLLWVLIETDKVMRKEQWESRIIGEVHDSMLLDVHPDELDHVIETVQEIATKKLPSIWKWIIVPFNVEVEVADVDRPWSEIKAYKGVQ